MKTYFWFAIAGILLVAAGFTLIGTNVALAQDTATEAQPVIENPPFLADYYNAWLTSGHADTEAEAFNHWNEDGVVEADCAQCHSTPGYIDFLGGDGSEPGVVNNEAIPTGTTVTCDACHNQAAAQLTSVTFPSGAVIDVENSSARCMVCHQGRSSTPNVNAALEENGALADMNAVAPELGFVNIHYYPAAAALYGTEAQGGYEYEGNRYAVKFGHVEGMDTCASCHSPHTLEVELDTCTTCHEDVETPEDLRDIRMNGSLVDFDGDGDDFEGIYYEIEGLQELLYAAIQGYAAEVAGTPIVYDSHSYPYFFIDTDADGEVTEGEAIYPNAFNAWTGNLLTAAYNYQMSLKDPGAFAHNAPYYIGLLYDSIQTLNANISEPVDMEFAQRNPSGHFDSTAEAFRHWDEDGEVPGSCARCHSAEGLPMWLANNATIAVEPSSALACSTCHDDLVEFTTYVVDEVTFPSGVKASFGEGEEDNLCLACHQGRESTVSVNRAIGSLGDDEVGENLGFRNVHYFAAGATLFGGETQGAYQFADREYVGRNVHVEDEVATCSDCHDSHRQELDLDTCTDCHEDVESVEDVRLLRVSDDPQNEQVDFNGNGDVEEPMRDEIQSLLDDLYAQIQNYAATVIGTGIVYDSHAYPYFFVDTNGDGVADADELTYNNAFTSWTPSLLRTAYNFQYVQKDGGAYVHNPLYTLQVLYDSIEALGGADAVASYIRPS